MNIYPNNDKNNCCGCGACINICPHNAITMQTDEYGFTYPIVDQARCVTCGLCSGVCEKVNKNERGMPLKAFAGYHRDREVLSKSSSGGAFSALAEHFLSTGGAVCGCIFDNDLRAVHICTEKKSDLIKIRKSKYLQSNVGLIYREVKKRLNNGQAVLFTGTPCQVAALYAVLGKTYDNLTTMDLVCHGVPSQFMFDRFIKYLEKRHNTQIVNFEFRSKKYGWQRFTMEYTDSKQRVVNIGKAQEFYIPAFTGGNITRPSCLSCKYACPNRVGDITIGDFWGYEKAALNYDTSKGLSLFTLNTEKAMNLFDVLSKNLECTEIDYNIAVNGNTCLHNPTAAGTNRDQYMQALKDDKIDAIALKYRKAKRNVILRERLKLLVPYSVFTAIKKKRNRA